MADVMVIEAARSSDLSPVLALLEQNRLPLDGVADHLPTMIVARENGRVVGVAALEIYADGAALLRSVAVDPARHGQGLGRALTDVALHMVDGHGVTDVLLLTTTAERFFSTFGFDPIPRDEAPRSVQASVEFSSACPASAIVMRKRLHPRT
jgi:amino-acid N-acetyltransferase